MNTDDHRLRYERQRQARLLEAELSASAARDLAAAEAARDVGPRTDRKAKRLAREQEWRRRKPGRDD